MFSDTFIYLCLGQVESVAVLRAKNVPPTSASEQM